MSLYGGKLKEIPKPWKREFPSKTKKRRVELDIYTWRGSFPGAIHWHVDLNEEANLIWNKKIKDWQRAHDDKEAKGRSFHIADLLSLVAAQDWVQGIRLKNFPTKTHVLIDKDGTGKRWIYKRVGA